ncbi:MAG: His/Gly/Thr/Pro-type tRNA ligase C-terminal domain-containing protein, partial [Metallosphaera sp.]
LPLWLSPIHVRVLKLTESEEVDKLSLSLKERGIRVQVDDLDEGIGKKIRRAGMDWIPYVAIVGERELQTKNLTVKVRDGSEQKPMTVEELEKVVREADDLMLPSNLPLSMKELKGVYENG